MSSHWAIELRSDCKREESCCVLMLQQRMQSSAKRRIVLLMASSEVVDVTKIVWGPEQYLGAHRTGQDGRRIASRQKQLSAISLANNFESRYVWFL